VLPFLNGLPQDRKQVSLPSFASPLRLRAFAVKGFQLMYQFNWRPVLDNFDLLLKGLALGLGLAIAALALGSAIGLATAFARAYGPRPLRIAATAYVEAVRNIPLLLIIYFAYFGLPLLGVSLLDNVGSFILALAVYAGAYLTEVFRAGIEGVPRGQLEAARALGLTRLQVARHVTVPLMFRIALPSLGNTFISLFKDTSVASAIAVPELTYGAIRINVNTWRVIEVYLVVGALYLVACYAIAGALRVLERRFGVEHRWS
jgi:His/Glu/Gln/Arg/opine family amino acid ABC transporter permease subunit